MHKYVRKDVFPKISTRTSEQEVHAYRARRGGFYTTKNMHPRPKRHTPMLRNRCAGTTQALHTSPKDCMLTSKATCTYTREYLYIHKGVHAHTQRNTWTYTKKYMHIYKGVHTLIRKEHMHLYKGVHAFGLEVVMRALRNTRTHQGEQTPLNMEEHAHAPRSTCAYIKEYMHLYERNTCTYTKKYIRLAKKL